MPALMTSILVDEYKTIIAELGPDATDDQVIRALVENADWTQAGAQALLALARNYGVFMLRNALALANAMQIHDGQAGF
ncbi:MAG TPA: hypothetical protein VKJ65_01675 [Phycisphaerae bacterium]|nr:hypothetical protein [Phycisphaerae bacterium]